MISNIKLQHAVLIVVAVYFLGILFVPTNFVAAGYDDLFQLIKVGGLDEIGTSAYMVSDPDHPKDIPTIVATVVRIFLTLLGTIFIVLIIWGGLMWMTARGKEDQVNNARTIIINATVGLAIILAAYSITYFIFDVILQATI